MDNSNIRSWKTIIDKNGTGAETIMTKVDMYLAKLVKCSSTKPYRTITKANIAVKLGQAFNCSVIQCPSWDKGNNNSIQARCNQADEDVPYSATIYRNVSNIASVNNSSIAEQTINAPILGLSMYTFDERLMQQQVNISFQIFNNLLGNPMCSFLDTSKNQWSTDGCRLIEHIVSEGMVHCQCDHLTNFAILMNPSIISSAPSPEMIQQEHALRVFTIVGCSFSIVGLVLTIIVYAVFWRTVKSGRSIHLIVLCCTFLFMYILFLTGVDKTGNKDVCTAIAVLLHYSILVVFFLMLAEGITIALLVLRPLKKQELYIQCILAAFLIPLVIVGVSMGATQLNGYGNEFFCWLEVGSGLFWSYVAVILTIIIVNAVLLCIVVKFGVCGITAMARKSEIDKIKAGIRSIAILIPVFGLTWIFNVFAINEASLVFQWLYVLLNTLQGVMIFVVKCVMEKKICKEFLVCWRRRTWGVPGFSSSVPNKVSESKVFSGQNRKND